MLWLSSSYNNHGRQAIDKSVVDPFWKSWWYVYVICIFSHYWTIFRWIQACAMPPLQQGGAVGQGRLQHQRSLFSYGGLIATDHRSSLSGEKLDQILFLRENALMANFDLGWLWIALLYIFVFSMYYWIWSRINMDMMSSLFKMVSIFAGTVSVSQFCERLILTPA